MLLLASVATVNVAPDPLPPVAVTPVSEVLTKSKLAASEAAAAFERALASGTAPEQAAKMQFESKRDEPEWEDLKKLSNSIIEQKSLRYSRL